MGRNLGTIKEKPTGTVRLRFLRSGQIVEGCSTVQWFAVNSDMYNQEIEDFAVIALPARAAAAEPLADLSTKATATSPEAVSDIAPLVPMTLGTGVLAFREAVACYNVASSERVWSYGRVGFPRPNNSLQLGPDPDNIGASVNRGCSGGPAMRPTGFEVVGMIVSARNDGTAAWFTPLHLLSRGWPALILSKPPSSPPASSPKSEVAKTHPMSQFRISLSRSWPLRGFPTLVGRSEELEYITKARCEAQTGIYVLVGAGGEGKTAIIKYWLKAVRDSKSHLGASLVLAYSFYHQGTLGSTQPSADDLIDWALRECGRDDIAASPAEAWMKGKHLADALIAANAILLLDGLETMQDPVRVEETGAHPVMDRGLASLLHHLMMQPEPTTFCLISTRLRVHDLCEYELSTSDQGDTPPDHGGEVSAVTKRQTIAKQHDLPTMSEPAAVELLQLLGVPGTPATLAELRKS